MTTLVNLWCGPRNVSTALMYAFRERPDTAVVDEPLYGAWLARTGADHPARGATLAAQDHDPQRVAAALASDRTDAHVVVAKQMAGHLVGLVDEPWLGPWLDASRNVVLCRAPEPVVASYVEQVEEPTVDGLGYTTQLRLVHRALARGEQPVVLTTERLLADPPGVLARCCERLGLAFDPTMLAWPAGPVPEDGPWAPWWYERTHASTGFTTPRQRAPQLTPALAEVAAAARPAFEELASHAL